MTQADITQASHVDGSYRRQTLRRARMTIQLIVLSLVLAITWAHFAQINEITRGDGRVIPVRRMQTIQSLEGGILSSLAVQEGEMVQKGQLLARLDPTRSEAAFLATQGEIEALTAEVARLEAEVLEQPALDFGATPSEAEAAELRLFQPHRAEIGIRQRRGRSRRALGRPATHRQHRRRGHQPRHHALAPDPSHPRLPC